MLPSVLRPIILYIKPGVNRAKTKVIYLRNVPRLEVFAETSIIKLLVCNS